MVKTIQIQQPGQGQDQDKPSRESLDQLLHALKNYQDKEKQRSQVLTILKANPSLMAAFVKQRAIYQQNQEPPNVQNPGTSTQVQVTTTQVR